ALEVRAPIAGRIAEVGFAPGAYVEEGARLFRIVDGSAPWIEIHVPAADASALDAARGGWASIDGRERPTALSPERFVARSPAIDPDSQTLRVVYALPADDGDVIPGLLATAYLRIGEPITALVVPSPALVEDGPATVVYVQVEGEAFERRVVRVIAREGERVGVEGDVRVGEHVATRGAYSVRLAASSGSAPAHGHAH
nr:efflux RND transporter periplasmic adaptor subunit [Myxococcota bacterium]